MVVSGVTAGPPNIAQEGRREGGFLARRGAVAGLLPHQHRDQGGEPHPDHDGDPGRTVPDQPERYRDRRGQLATGSHQRDRSMMVSRAAIRPGPLPCSRPAPPSPKPLKLGPASASPGPLSQPPPLAAGAPIPGQAIRPAAFRPARWLCREAPLPPGTVVVQQGATEAGAPTAARVDSGRAAAAPEGDGGRGAHDPDAGQHRRRSAIGCWTLKGRVTIPGTRTSRRRSPVHGS